MMRDMKYEIHCIAERIANEKHGCDFYDLSKELQSKVWGKAEAEWNDKQIDKAEHMLEEAKLEGKVTYGPNGGGVIE